MKKAWILSYPLSAERRLWSDRADAQTDLSLRLTHMPFCWFCHEAAQFYSIFSQLQTDSLLTHRPIFLFVFYMNPVHLWWRNSPGPQLPANTGSCNICTALISLLCLELEAMFKTLCWKSINTRICFLRENWCLSPLPYAAPPPPPSIGVMQFCTESQGLIQQRGINSESK